MEVTDPGTENRAASGRARVELNPLIGMHGRQSEERKMRAHVFVTGCFSNANYVTTVCTLFICVKHVERFRFDI